MLVQSAKTNNKYIKNAYSVILPYFKEKGAKESVDFTAALSKI